MSIIETAIDGDGVVRCGRIRILNRAWNVVIATADGDGTEVNASDTLIAINGRLGPVQMCKALAWWLTDRYGVARLTAVLKKAPLDARNMRGGRDCGGTPFYLTHVFAGVPRNVKHNRHFAAEYELAFAKTVREMAKPWAVNHGKGTIAIAKAPAPAMVMATLEAMLAAWARIDARRGLKPAWADAPAVVVSRDGAHDKLPAADCSAWEGDWLNFAAQFMPD